MRLIDADKLHPDVMTKRGALAISQGQLAYAPTVNAVSEEVYTREYNLRKDAEFKVYKLEKAIDEIKAEIREFSVVDESGTYRISTYLVDQIIDKYRGEVDCRECKAEHECYECKKYEENEDKE